MRPSFIRTAACFTLTEQRSRKTNNRKLLICNALSLTPRLPSSLAPLPRINSIAAWRNLRRELISRKQPSYSKKQLIVRDERKPSHSVLGCYWNSRARGQCIGRALGGRAGENVGGAL